MNNSALMLNSSIDDKISDIFQLQFHVINIEVIHNALCLNCVVLFLMSNLYILCALVS